MTLIRMVTSIPETSIELALKLIIILTKLYLRVDLVADCYFKTSLKAVGRAKRGSTAKIIIKSTKSVVLRDFSNFCPMEEKRPA